MPVRQLIYGNFFSKQKDLENKKQKTQSVTKLLMGSSIYKNEHVSFDSFNFQPENVVKQRMSLISLKKSLVVIANSHIQTTIRTRGDYFCPPFCFSVIIYYCGGKFIVAHPLFLNESQSLQFPQM